MKVEIPPASAECEKRLLMKGIFRFSASSGSTHLTVFYALERISDLESSIISHPETIRNSTVSLAWRRHEDERAYVRAR